ncbi:MAG: fused ferrous iron transport protein A/B [Elusimicrobia bacterium]|nr:fused ferrous iron transport protein A/B [Elusimicrobiota bacterium]
MNLLELPNSETADVVSLDGGGSFKSKLMAMGIHKGRRIRKVSGSTSRVPVIVEVMGSKVAIGREMAEHITVKTAQLNLMLAGNPNVGKSVVFSRLTGLDVISSNYPGTTVEVSRGTAKLAGAKFDVTDVPGAYSLAPACPAEDVACRLLLQEKADLVIDVLDATNLERNLFFGLQLLEKGLPVIFLLNKWDIARRNGISIAIEEFSRRLGAPAVPFVAVTGEGLNELNETVANILRHGLERPRQVPIGDDGKWQLIGDLSRQVQKITHKHPSFLEKLEDLSVVPLTGIPMAAATMAAAFYAVRELGEALTKFLTEPVFNLAYMPLISHLAGPLKSCAICFDLLFGRSGQAMESFGVLTTGVYVPFVVVLPYIFSFYLVLGFFEDLGYLPRLAVLLDRLMHKLGLHGYGTIPLMLGLGCKVPAMLATRVLETRRERLIAMTLALFIAPCLPQSAMILSLLGPHGLKYVAVVFAGAAGIGIFSGFMLNRLIKGETPELFVEIPPYHIPRLKTLMTKVWMRLRGFIVEAAPMIMLGVMIVNILEMAGVMAVLTAVFEPAVRTLLGLPGETASVMVLGFLRKDVSILLLAPFHLTAGQLTVACLFLTLYLPCLATFTVMVKESGFKDAVRVSLLGLVVALAAASALNLLAAMGSGLWGQVFICHFPQGSDK